MEEIRKVEERIRKVEEEIREVELNSEQALNREEGNYFMNMQSGEDTLQSQISCVCCVTPQLFPIFSFNNFLPYLVQCS